MARRLLRARATLWGSYRRALALALWVVVGFGSSVAQADDTAPVFTLEYTHLGDAPPCADASALRARVADLLGDDPFVDDARRTLHVWIDPAGSPTVRVEIGVPGERLLGYRVIDVPGGDCDAIVVAAALVISVALEPLRVSAPPAPDLPLTPDPFATEAPLPGNPWTPEITAAAVGGLGQAPGPLGGARLEAGVARGRWSAHLGGELWLPSTTTWSAQAGATATLRTASLAGCRHWGPWALCGTARAGTLDIQGRAEVPADSRSWYGATGLRAHREFALRRGWAARVQAEGLATVTGTSLRLRVLDQGSVRLQEVWRTPPAAAGLSVSVVRKFE